jgi:predicted ABC-type ATPase
MSTKRLRIFAGPNGSGKSTLVKTVTSEYKLHYGYFVNADEIEREFAQAGFFDFSPCDLEISQSDLEGFIQSYDFARVAQFPPWHISENRLFLHESLINSYHAAVLAEFLRQRLMAAGVTFSTETVMSAPQKLDMMRYARAQGYRVYLYFVATESPIINQVRVHNRVKLGGHYVPAEKIHNRYFRSLERLYDAIKLTDRAYLFDNTQELEWVAEIVNGRELSLKKEDVPNWFIEYIEQKIYQRNLEAT